MANTATARKRSTATRPTTKAKAEHPLAHLIPSSDVADAYISRLIWGVRDVDLLWYARAAHKNVALYGPTGGGKTHLVHAFAAAHGIPVVTVQSNGGIDPTTFFGQYVPYDEDGKQGFRWEYSEVAQVVKYGGILYVNEGNLMLPKALAGLWSVTDWRRSITILENGNEVIHAADDLMVIVDWNPGYAGTRPLSKAFKNRFAVKVPWEYDAEVESQLTLMPVMNEIASKIRARAADGDFETPVSTNMLVDFEELAVDLGRDFAVENFISAFESNEQPVVREVFTAYGDQIDSDLAEMVKMASEGS